MKLLLTAAFALQVLFLATTTTDLASGEGDHDDETTTDMDLCADFNVTNTISCEEWCGPTMTAEWMYLTGHGHYEDLHLAYLVGWMCHCSPQTETEEGKHCGTPIEFPTCSAMGLADCGSNATMTCGELCDAVGLGAGGTGTAATRRGRRHLYHTTNDHFCSHRENDQEDPDTRRRILHGDEEHAEDGVTLCYCNAVEENSDGSTVVCADADLTEEPQATETPSSGTGVTVVGGSILGAAVMGFLYL